MVQKEITGVLRNVYTATFLQHEDKEKDQHLSFFIFFCDKCILP